MTEPALEGARVLITGGAGFIGSHLADLLAESRVAEIVVFDNFSRGRPENLATARESGRVVVIEGDICDRAEVARAMRGVDLLFHLAAIRLTHCAEDPRLAFDVMATGTFNVLEAAVEAHVGKVIAASSASVYGMADQFPTPEDYHPYRNKSLYGALKMFDEGLLASFRDMFGLRYVALRPFNVYGPRMDIQGAYTEVLIRWMERIARGLPPVIFGAAGQSMDLIFVEDVARAFLRASERDVDGEVFNVGSGVETTLEQLARALLEAMDSDLPLEYGPERKAPAVWRRLADTRKARDLLGFEAQVSLNDGLRRLVDWWRRKTALR